MRDLRLPHALAALALVAAYLALRLVRVGTLPMFADEGTYITWGLRALHPQSLRDTLASLEDGKQPLLPWLMAPFLALVPDRLIAGRAASVAAGLANLALITALGRRLFGPVAAVVTAILYVVAPVALIHDRMALYESLVTTTALLMLWTALAWADRPTWRRTAVVAAAVAAALLTKLSTLFFILLVPLAIALWRPAALRCWPRLAVAFGAAGVVYGLLTLGPGGGNLAEGNARYALTAAELVRAPVALWWRNTAFVGMLAVAYLGWPIVLLAAAGLAYGLVLGGRGGRVAALWTLVPPLGLILTARLFYPRYAAPCLVTALLPAAHALAALAGRARPARTVVRTQPARLRLGAACVVAAACAVPGAAFAARLVSDPATAPWIDAKDYLSDRWQYVQGDEAGYGLDAIVVDLRRRAATQPVVVLTWGATGMPHDGVAAYLRGWPNVVLGALPDDESIEARLQRVPDDVSRAAARGAEVVAVLSSAPDGEQERRFHGLNADLPAAVELPKPGGHSRFTVYRLPLLDLPGATRLSPPVQLGNAVALRGFALASATVRPGEALRLALYWQSVAPAGGDYTAFNHLLTHAGPSDKIWGQKDGEPAAGAYPTSQWRPGETVTGLFTIPVNADAPPGDYDLVTGLYDRRTLQRLPVLREGAAAEQHVLLTRIVVTRS